MYVVAYKWRAFILSACLFLLFGFVYSLFNLSLSVYFPSFQLQPQTYGTFTSSNFHSSLKIQTHPFPPPPFLHANSNLQPTTQLKPPPFGTEGGPSH